MRYILVLLLVLAFVGCEKKTRPLDNDDGRYNVTWSTHEDDHRGDNPR